MSYYPVVSSINNQGLVYVSQNVPSQRRGLSVSQNEQAVRDACLAHALGANRITTYDPNSYNSTNVVIGAGGSNPIQVSNVGTAVRPVVTVVAPPPIHNNRIMQNGAVRQISFVPTTLGSYGVGYRI